MPTSTAAEQLILRPCARQRAASSAERGRAAAGLHLKADSAGGCECGSASVQLGIKCVPVEAVAVLLCTIAAAAAAAACCLRRAGVSAAGGRDQWALGRAVAELRRRMRVRRRDGFVLSTERAPMLQRCAVVDSLQVLPAAAPATMRALRATSVGVPRHPHPRRFRLCELACAGETEVAVVDFS